MRIMVVVDMQNDFIDGALGSVEAQKIVANAVENIKNFEGKIFCTLDTHFEDYLTTQEGKKLPIEHCIKGTKGWTLNPDIAKAISGKGEIIEKPTFGSMILTEKIINLAEKENIEEIILFGLCTDICVISNAMLLKAALPEVKIVIAADACAGVTPESHHNALQAMKCCQIEVRGE